jgi:alpha-tubulin suppressor-like RCC1 family protein
VDATSPTSTSTATKTTTSTATGPYLQVTTGMRHSCAIRSNGTVVCWGYNCCGQTRPPAGSFTQVSGGILHTCGIRTDGSAVCWGGHGSCASSSAPGGNFTKISAGDETACGLTAQGTVACWGCPSNGVPVETAPADLGTAIDVGANGRYFCAVTAAGNLSCWGETLLSSLPTLSGLDSVSLNGSIGFGCIHASSGSYHCWQDIIVANTGQPTSHEASADPDGSPPGLFAKVRAGAGHFCGIRANQTVECWGFNPDGRATPPSGTFLDVAPGGFHTCGLRTDHTISCWGDSSDGATTPPSP